MEKLTKDCISSIQELFRFLYHADKQFEDKVEIENALRALWEKTLADIAGTDIKKILHIEIRRLREITEDVFGEKMRRGTRIGQQAIMRRVYCYVLYRHLLLSKSTAADIVGIDRTTATAHVNAFKASLKYDHKYKDKLKEVEADVQKYILNTKLLL